MSGVLVGVVPVQTERLRGERPQPADLEPWSRVFLDDRIPEEWWPSDQRTPQAALETHDRNVAHWERWGFGLWTVRERGSRRYVGRIGLKHTRATGQPEVEVGWFVDPDLWSRGYATEMAREAVRVGFEVLELDAVIAYTTEDNEASRRVMGKLGMEYEQHIEHAGLAHVVYRVTRRP